MNKPKGRLVSKISFLCVGNKICVIISSMLSARWNFDWTSMMGSDKIFRYRFHANCRKRSLFRVINEVKLKFLIKTPQKEVWLKYDSILMAQVESMNISNTFWSTPPNLQCSGFDQRNPRFWRGRDECICQRSEKGDHSSGEDEGRFPNFFWCFSWSGVRPPGVIKWNGLKGQLACDCNCFYQREFLLRLSFFVCLSYHFEEH